MLAQVRPSCIVVDKQALYWDADRVIMKCDLRGGDPTDIAACYEGIGSIACYGMYLYLTTVGKAMSYEGTAVGRVLRVRKDGSYGIPDVMADGLLGPGAIAVNEGAVFVADPFAGTIVVIGR